MKKLRKIYSLLLVATLIFSFVSPKQKVSAVTISDQVEGTVVFNEYDSFKLRYDEPTVLKLVLPEDGTFKLDLNPDYISELRGYIYDEFGNELYYDYSYSATKEITQRFFGCSHALEAGTYYLKIWTNNSYYDGGVDVTYYGGFTPSATQDIEICLNLKVGKTIQLDTILFNAPKKKVNWKSSKSSVATVSSSGKIKGIKKGNATIKAYTDDGLVAKIVVKVSK